MSKVLVPLSVNVNSSMFIVSLKAYDSSDGTAEEETILDALLATVASKDAVSAYSFLEANSGNESCKKLLTMWNW